MPNTVLKGFLYSFFVLFTKLYTLILWLTSVIIFETIMKLFIINFFHFSLSAFVVFIIFSLKPKKSIIIRGLLCIIIMILCLEGGWSRSTRKEVNVLLSV